MRKYNISLDEKTIKTLDAYAERMGTTRSGAVRAIVAEYEYQAKIGIKKSSR